LFISAAIWKVTGSKKIGNVLIEGLDSPDETLRMISGVLLARAGSKIIPILRDALESQQSLSILLTIIGDVGEIEEVPLLEKYEKDERPDVAVSAHEALRVLRARCGLKGSE
jgi:HEAT repeat protein